jgi:hypothetical protein
VLASSAVDREFEPRSGQTKDYKIAICFFSAKHEALRRKSKVGGFLWVSSTNKTDHYDITEIVLKVALNIIALTILNLSTGTYITGLFRKLVKYCWS